MSIASFIPNRISNRRVVGILDHLRRFQRRFGIARRRCKKHKNKNRIAVDRLLGSFGEQKALPGEQFYLENQNSYGDIEYGRSDMAYAGCEIIAVYNALSALHRRVDLTDLISEFERDGMVFSGRFGTSPLALRDHLLGLGLQVDTVFELKDFDEAASKADVLILVFYNDFRSIFRKVHTVCVTRSDRGFTSHNTYGDGRCIGPFSSVKELMENINGGFAKGIVMFAVKRS